MNARRSFFGGLNPGYPGAKNRARLRYHCIARMREGGE